jgi:hypothetical protein
MKQTIVLSIAAAVAVPTMVIAQATVNENTGQRTLAATMNIHVFPASGQAADQQNIEEAECYNWAVNNTGTDPFDLSRQAQQQEQQADRARQDAQKAGEGSGAAGAVIGAAGGALIGQVVSSDPGRGAAWGAGLGFLGGRASRRQAQAKASQQVESQAASQQRATQEQITNFKNAFSVCLEAKGYMVRF